MGKAYAQKHGVGQTGMTQSDFTPCASSDAEAFRQHDSSPHLASTENALSEPRCTSTDLNPVRVPKEVESGAATVFLMSPSTAPKEMRPADSPTDEAVPAEGSQLETSRAEAPKEHARVVDVDLKFKPCPALAVPIVYTKDLTLADLKNATPGTREFAFAASKACAEIMVARARDGGEPLRPLPAVQIFLRSRIDRDSISKDDLRAAHAQLMAEWRGMEPEMRKAYEQDERILQALYEEHRSTGPYS